MKTPVALLNLWHDRTKTAVSIAGVAFALLLVFAQLGFMGAVSFTATNVYDKLNFDILLRSENYVHLYEPGTIDRQVLSIVRNTPGVESANPFWIAIHNWRRLDEFGNTVESSELQAVAIMGILNSDSVFKSKDIHQLIADGKLVNSNQLLIDDFTQAPFAPRDGEKFKTGRDIGTEAEIGSARFSISGVYRLGTGLAANGAVITNDAGFARIMPWNVNKTISLGLIKVNNGEDVESVRQAIAERLRLTNFANTDEATVTAIGRDQALNAEEHRWLRLTPIGLIFEMGVIISLFVGAAIVYMVLATDVTDRLPEYATLLAIGYSRIYLASMVMTQAITLAIVGFVIATILASALYYFGSEFSGIPMAMTLNRLYRVFLLGIVTCCFSGMLALRKLWKAEPANLF